MKIMLSKFMQNIHKENLNLYLDQSTVFIRIFKPFYVIPKILYFFSSVIRTFLSAATFLAPAGSINYSHRFSTPSSITGSLLKLSAPVLNDKNIPPFCCIISENYIVMESLTMTFVMLNCVLFDLPLISLK